MKLLKVATVAASFLVFNFLILASLPACAMQRQATSMQRSHLTLKTLPAEYEGKRIIWLEPALAQGDGFSCGDRAIFHAIGLYGALKTTRNANDFVRELNNNFSSQALLSEVLRNVAMIIPRKQPLNSTALNQILEVFFPDLAPRTMLLTGHQGYAGIPGQAVNATESYLIAAALMLRSPNEAVFVICDVGYHAVLCALVTDANKRASMYIVDSLANSSLDSIRPFLRPLLAVLQAHNASL